ncbi:MAG: MFS transporter [Acidobacteriota bacterium]|nr:MFS transporter [Acidobacteriota bacterium]
MPLLANIRALSPAQRTTFAGCFLAWTLDAFDFFLLTFCLTAIAAEFQVTRKAIEEAIFWTLVMRPVGALLFGALAERFGRRPVLMLNIAAYSLAGLASAFAPTLTSFLVLRAIFGIAMGGEWGVGAALALETLPSKGRGFFSGLLQEGYPIGNLLAAGFFGLLFSHLHGPGSFSSWRLLFMLGVFPSMGALYLCYKSGESPVWLARRSSGAVQKPASADWVAIRRYIPTFGFLVLLMFAFTSFSHGTQDLYPTFLRDHGLSPGRIGLVAAIGNIGALLGGVTCGTLSERFGRRRTIAVAALMAIPMVPLWAWSHTAATLALGGFLMQFMVQGAWGIIPAHLNELAPAPVRAVLPGLAYQLGNLLASRNAIFQQTYADRHNGGVLNVALSGTVVIVAILVATITSLGTEAKGTTLAAPQS